MEELLECKPFHIKYEKTQIKYYTLQAIISSFYDVRNVVQLLVTNY